ncbi:hypothetical protein [Ralstonia solanacearum]|uniref:hypothetical protein n=1 Tax=Ralstonia solanacearum TaxID=305 RepID=UPI000AE3FC88|nr:hypothetical protein [Ralstonia solanacearum]
MHQCDDELDQMLRKEADEVVGIVFEALAELVIDRSFENQGGVDDVVELDWVQIHEEGRAQQ